MGISVVTGANRGIGLELCRLLRARGHEVVGVCRRSSPVLDALGVRVEADIDVRERAAGALLARRLGDASIDWLVHNAGVLRHEGLEDVTAASMIEQFEVNAMAPVLLTQALLPRLHEGSRIALVTSLMGSIADNRSGGAYGYRMSKAALNIAGVSLARDLESRRIWVAIVHPGYVKTDMTGGSGNVEPADAAAGILARIDELGPATTGRFVHQTGRELPW
jgi:NAD(P)-dependent dehydrogenase (short-subunit alcohol dehydrogenase family)